jgi:hypothetical protein
MIEPLTVILRELKTEGITQQLNQWQFDKVAFLKVLVESKQGYDKLVKEPLYKELMDEFPEMSLYDSNVFSNLVMMVSSAVDINRSTITANDLLYRVYTLHNMLFKIHRLCNMLENCTDQQQPVVSTQPQLESSRVFSVPHIRLTKQEDQPFPQRPAQNTALDAPPPPQPRTYETPAQSHNVPAQRSQGREEHPTDGDITLAEFLKRLTG